MSSLRRAIRSHLDSRHVARVIYGDAKYDLLRALKRVWDPDNVFRLNQNIQP